MGKFIDMDKLVLPKDTVGKIQKKGVPAILDWLAEQESVEVIRCKDCKYSESVPKWKDFELGCMLHREYTTATDFCSQAERKETNG